MKCSSCGNETNFNFGSRKGSFCKECSAKEMDKIDVKKCSVCGYDFIITLDKCPICAANSDKLNEFDNQVKGINIGSTIKATLKYCTKCGKENNDDSSYCSNCGNSLATKKSKTKKHFITLGLISIVILSTIFISIFIYKSFSPVSSSKNETKVLPNEYLGVYSNFRGLTDKVFAPNSEVIISNNNRIQILGIKIINGSYFLSPNGGADGQFEIEPGITIMGWGITGRKILITINGIRSEGRLGIEKLANGNSKYWFVWSITLDNRDVNLNYEKVGNNELSEYYNERFSFRLKYPSQKLIPLPQPANGDGQEFLSGDGKIKLLVYGNEINSNESLEQVFNREIDNTVSYKTINKNNHWFVISGIRNNEIYYLKKFLKNDAWITYIISFPTSMKSIGASLIDQTVNTLSLD